MPFLHGGELIGSGISSSRWYVLRKLGEGQFAEVYEVEDREHNNQKCALKVEKGSKPRTVKNEYKTLRKLGEHSQRVCQVIEEGSHEGHAYFVMELLGDNLAHVLRSKGCFDEPAARRIALNTLTTLEELHRAFHIHRDVKPANFVSSSATHQDDPTSCDWKLIDFGLARKYTDDAGNHVPERLDTFFRGSTSYASVFAHEEKDLSRRDDLWSWFYMIVELLDGTLPWRVHGAKSHGDLRDLADSRDAKDRVYQQKVDCIQCPERLMRNGALPEGLKQINGYIHSLDFADEPDYDRIRSWLQTVGSGVSGLASFLNTSRLVSCSAAAAQNTGNNGIKNNGNRNNGGNQGDAMQHANGSTAAAPAVVATHRSAAGGVSPTASPQHRSSAHSSHHNHRESSLPPRDKPNAASANGQRKPQQQQQQLKRGRDEGRSKPTSSGETQPNTVSHQRMQSMANLVKQGKVSKATHRVAKDLLTLDPAEALGVMACALDCIAQSSSTPPNLVAQLMAEFGVYTQHLRKAARDKRAANRS